MLPDFCFFFTAGGSDAEEPAGFVGKLMGRATAEGFKMVLEVTNVTRSYCTQFSLDDVINEVEEEACVQPSPENLVDWLREHFDAGDVEADVGADGALRMCAEHHWLSGAADYKINLRLPPGTPMQPMADPRRAAWVTQEVLFTQAERTRSLARRLQACEQRCPLEQQFEELLAFLVAGGGGPAGAAAAAAAASAAVAAVEGGDTNEGPRADNGQPAKLEGPRVAHFLSKRKLIELEAAAVAAAAGKAPPSGSAVKAARPGGTGAPGSPTSAAAGSKAAAAAHPASTQVTGGGSTATQRTDRSKGVVAKKVIQRPKTGAGVTRVGPQRRK